MHRLIYRFALLLSAAIPFASFAIETKLTVNDPYVSLVPPNSQAVSYTHLDVYKRQSNGYSTANLPGSGRSTYNCGAP